MSQGVTRRDPARRSLLAGPRPWSVVSSRILAQQHVLPPVRRVPPDFFHASGSPAKQPCYKRGQPTRGEDGPGQHISELSTQYRGAFNFYKSVFGTEFEAASTGWATSRRRKVSRS